MTRLLRPILFVCVCLLVLCLAQPATFAGASLDIGPSICPNVVSVDARPMMRAAIVSDVDFVASRIDRSSLEMTRSDGVGGSVTPVMRPRRRAPRVLDVAAPASSETCSTFGADGLYDLVFRFRQSEVVEQLQLGDVPENTVVEVCVSGQIKFGGAFEACDQLIVTAFGVLTPPQSDDIGTRTLLRQ